MSKLSPKVVIDTTPEVVRALQQLVETWLFGETVEDAAEMLLRERIRDLELQGFVRR